MFPLLGGGVDREEYEGILWSNGNVPQLDRGLGDKN